MLPRTSPGAIALAALLLSSSALAQTPDTARAVLGRHVSLGAGALGTGFGFVDGRWGDLSATQQVEARWLFGPLALEGGVMNALPVSSSGVNTQAVTGTLRVGYSGERLSLTGGVNLQYAPVAEPATQLLPTVKATWAFDSFALTAALFDVHALMIARLSVDVGEWGLGYVAPIGAEVHARFPIRDGFGIGVQAFAAKVASAQFAFVAVSGTWEPPAEGGAR